MHLIHEATRRDDSWWPGHFEHQRLAQHAIMRRATEANLLARYIDDGRTVTLVCRGPARLAADVLDDLLTEHILGFEVYATRAEFDVLLDVAAMQHLPKDHVDFYVDQVPPKDPAGPGASEPHDYDRRTLPELIRALVAKPNSGASPVGSTSGGRRAAFESYYRGLRSKGNETRIEFVAPSPGGGASIRAVHNPLDTETYDWRNLGTGAERTSEAVLCDVTDDHSLAERLGNAFTREVVIHLRHGFEAQPISGTEWTEEWRLTADEVRAWISDPRNRRGPEGPDRPFP